MKKCDEVNYHRKGNDNSSNGRLFAAAKGIRSNKRTKKNVNFRMKGYKVQPQVRLEFLQKLEIDPEKVQIDVFFAGEKDAQEKLYMTEKNSA